MAQRTTRPIIIKPLRGTAPIRPDGQGRRDGPGLERPIAAVPRARIRHKRIGGPATLPTCPDLGEAYGTANRGEGAG